MYTLDIVGHGHFQNLIIVSRARNADVGFVLEFGGHYDKHGKGGIPAHGWMREANEKCADEMTEAEAKIYDEWLKSHNL